MSEFQTLPVDSPTPIAPPPPPRPAQGILTRPVFMGLSVPWLAGMVIVLAGAGWYLFWPTSSPPDAGQLAFGQTPGFSSVQPTVAAPMQTGGLNVPVNIDAAAGSSVPEEVVKMIREGRDFETANREAISRLSNTVRAQSAALASIQKQLETLTSQNATMANRLTVLDARQATPILNDGKTKYHSARRSSLSGMRIESIQDGMAWVSWQGRTWAVQAGDRLGSVTVLDVNAGNREVATSNGVLH